MVVVSGHDRDPTTGQRSPEVREEGACSRERVGERPVAKLDRVAQEHQVIDAFELGQQRPPELRPSQQIAPRSGTEVKVRDHGGEHAWMFTPALVCSSTVRSRSA